MSFRELRWGVALLLALAWTDRAEAWDLSTCQRQLESLHLDSDTIHRMPKLPDLSLVPGHGLADAANPVSRPLTATTPVITSPALTQTYRSAIDYFSRFRSEIERNLTGYQGPDKSELKGALSKLTDNSNLHALTHFELWEGIFAITKLRGGAQGDRPVPFGFDKIRFKKIMESGYMPLAIFRDKPLSMRDILLYQSTLILPLQIIGTSRVADGAFMNPYEFLSHDLAHTRRSSTELNRTDYLWLNEPDRATKLIALRRDRFNTLKTFLDEMPGIPEGDRRHVPKALFESFHETFPIALGREIPTDLRVLARYLRRNSSRIGKEGSGYDDTDYPMEMGRRGFPRDAARRILLAISRIPDHLDWPQ